MLNTNTNMAYLRASVDGCNVFPVSSATRAPRSSHYMYMLDSRFQSLRGNLFGRSSCFMHETIGLRDVVVMSLVGGYLPTVHESDSAANRPEWLILD
jgi:hypothetical protein